MRILWLKTELLHPIDKGGRIRTYQMLRQLKSQHHVTYLSLLEPDVDPEAHQQASQYCHKLVTVPWRAPARYSPAFYAALARNVASPLPYALAKYRSGRLQRELRRLVRREYFDVLVADFLASAVNVPERLELPAVLFEHNVESLIWQRMARTAADPLRKAYFYSQWRRMHRYESEACHRFDMVAAVSPGDRDMLVRDFGVKDVQDVPTGVDTEYFAPGPARPQAHKLVFTGSMDWLPNEDAIVMFVEQILSRIRQHVPQVQLTVVGRNPTPRLVKLAAQHPGVTLTGRVSDVRPYMDEALVYVVPLRIGGGTRIKIYEAMAMQKAVVSTRIGAEGLPVRDGEHLLLADEPADFAQAVTSLMLDQTRALAMGRQARKFVDEHFGWQQAADVFASICQRAVRERAAKLSIPRFAVPLFSRSKG